ncbi:hypothetical protein V500_04359 [Pseudogymnoascus sp. VKM F-4518 (FW-2643)]|nr:hypothetical protein V500_04359 [Pseudogymnoascus sp. VKM F-4518 (FW-2643)]
MTCLVHGFLPTQEVIFAAISHLKLMEKAAPPSQSWFTKWWKAHPSLRKIRTKPIATTRISGQDVETVKDWLEEFEAAITTYKIDCSKIHKLDESGFRVGCPKGQEVIIPLDIKELYSLSPEDRRSITIIEAICANGQLPIPPMIIIQGKHYVHSRYTNG